MEAAPVCNERAKSTAQAIYDTAVQNENDAYRVATSGIAGWFKKITQDVVNRHKAVLYDLDEDLKAALLSAGCGA
jgi:hypothetical protein